MISIAYISNRKDCKLDWAIDSLRVQLRHHDDVLFIITDFWNQVVDDWTQQDVDLRRDWVAKICAGLNFKHVAPMPNVWSGPYRHTKENWFSPAAQRNTAICHAPNGTICFLDDLSVPLPDFMVAVRESIAGGYCCYGAYCKRLALVVENGVPVYFREAPAGDDPRRPMGRPDRAVDIPASALYGCSFVIPVEAALHVNGFNQACDGLGSEDSMFGICLGKKGYVTKYDLRLGTLESEEDHFKEPPFIRRNKGTGHAAKDFAILNMTLRGNGEAANYFHEGSLRATRQHILNGGSFHTDPSPRHDFYDGEELRLMT